MSVATADDRDAFVENLAAELTSAAYPVVLRHWVGLGWLDLQLDLWKALSETIRRMEHADVDRLASPSRPPKASNFFG
jgi:hypothetical protein